MLTAMSQEHERGLGGWHAEWETLPDLFRLSAGALHRILETISGLEVDADRMLQNLEITHGLIYAEAVTMVLGKQIGKAAAHLLMEAASRKAIDRKIHLRDILSTDAEVSSRLSAAELDKLFDPHNYTGMANQFIDRAIAASKAGTG